MARGKELDPATGLYYYNARWYDADLGRFVTEDRYAGDPNQPWSLNRYVYVYGNPLKYVDPDGRRVEVIIGYKDKGIPHAALRITNDSGDWVYSFGRYTEYGAINKMKFKDYIEGIDFPGTANDVIGQDDYRNSRGYVLNASPEAEASMQKYTESFFSDSSKVQEVKGVYILSP